MMSTSKLLYLGRTAFEKDEWKDVLTHLLSADNEEPLAPDDLELLAVSAYLIGEFATCNDFWTRAHNSFLNVNDIPGAVRCAFWLGFTLMNSGEMVRGGGWIGHGRKLLDDHRVNCVEQGYLLLPAALRLMGAGDIQASICAFNQAWEIGNKFRDQDLLTLAHLGHGQALIRTGECKNGVAFLDEAMIAVESGRLSPIVTGIAYCAVIEACVEIVDLRRAGDWTNALNHWCASHPHMVPFRGQCLTRRAEIMRLHGEWTQAIEEAYQAIDLLTKPAPEPAVASAYYELGDLYRLQGEYARAEEAFCEANRFGRNPQPGLALLRLAQGQISKARSSIMNALTDTTKLKSRSEVLFACIEIMLAGEEITRARSTLNELKEITREIEAPLLQALAAQAEGAVLLSESDPESALTSLRNARMIWEELRAPYNAARTRSLMAMTFKSMGDDDSAKMEWEAARRTFQELNAVQDMAKIDKYFASRVSVGVNALSPREQEVLQLISEGKSNKTIADKLCISERTVERHISNIFAKLEVSSRTEAMAHSFKHKLI